MPAREEDLKFSSYGTKISYTKTTEGIWLQVVIKDGKTTVPVDKYTMKVINLKNSEGIPKEYKLDTLDGMFGGFIPVDTTTRQFIGLIYNDIGTMVKSTNFVIKV